MGSAVEGRLTGSPRGTPSVYGRASTAYSCLEQRTQLLPYRLAISFENVSIGQRTHYRSP